MTCQLEDWSIIELINAKSWFLNAKKLIELHLPKCSWPFFWLELKNWLTFFIYNRTFQDVRSSSELLIVDQHHFWVLSISYQVNETLIRHHSDNLHSRKGHLGPFKGRIQQCSSSNLIHEGFELSDSFGLRIRLRRVQLLRVIPLM